VIRGNVKLTKRRIKMYLVRFSLSVNAGKGMAGKIKAGNPNSSRRLSTINLLVRASLDHRLLILQTLFTAL